MALKRGHTAFPKPPAYHCLPLPRIGVARTPHQSTRLVSGAAGPCTCHLLPSLPGSCHRAGPPLGALLMAGGGDTRAWLSVAILSPVSCTLVPCDCPGPRHPLPSTHRDLASLASPPPSSRPGVSQKSLLPPAVASGRPPSARVSHA